MKRTEHCGSDFTLHCVALDPVKILTIGSSQSCYCFISEPVELKHAGVKSAIIHVDLRAGVAIATAFLHSKAFFSPLFAMFTALYRQIPGQALTGVMCC